MSCDGRQHSWQRGNDNRDNIFSFYELERHTCVSAICRNRKANCVLLITLCCELRRCNPCALSAGMRTDLCAVWPCEQARHRGVIRQSCAVTTIPAMALCHSELWYLCPSVFGHGTPSVVPTLSNLARVHILASADWPNVENAMRR